MNIYSWEDVVNSRIKISDYSAGTGISVGCFDGIHKGHQKLFNSLIEFCKEKSLSAGIITFNNNLTQLKSENKLSSNLIKPKDFSFLIEKFPQIKFCIVVDFTPEFAAMTGEEFFTILKEKLNLKFLAEGSDFKCGYKGSMGKKEIIEFCNKSGIKTCFVEPVYINEYKEGKISSSLIRKFILEGNISMASKMLGYPYFLSFTDMIFKKTESKQNYFLSKCEYYQIVPETGEYLIEDEFNQKLKIRFDKENIYMERIVTKAVFI